MFNNLKVAQRIRILLFLMIGFGGLTLTLVFHYYSQGEEDAKVVNIAGSQRMLSLEMAKNANAIAAGNEEARIALKGNILEYNASLLVLKTGGAAMGYEISPLSGAVRPYLDRNDEIWGEFQTCAWTVQGTPVYNPAFDDALMYVIRENYNMLAGAVDVLKAYNSLPDMTEYSFEIDVAGRLRMLSQFMTLHVHEVAHHYDEIERLELEEAIGLYDNAIYSLLDGGEVKTSNAGAAGAVKPAPGAVRTKLLLLEGQWKEFKSRIVIMTQESYQSRDFERALSCVNADSIDLKDASDGVVKGYTLIATQRVKKMKQMLAGLTVLGLVTFLFGSVFAERGITIPLSKLSARAGEIAAGNLSVRAPVETDDEIGELALSFNSMVENLETRINKRTSELTNANVGLMEEISQRKHAEAKVKMALDDWMVTFDSIKDGISIHDADMNILRANESLRRILSVSPEELIGKKCFLAFHYCQGPKENCPMERSMISKEPEHFEIFDAHLNSWLSISVYPKFDEKGEVSGVVHVTRDITEKKKAEDEIKSSLREKEILLQEVHHRVKNNLQFISSLLSLQSKQVKNREDYKVFKESQGQIKTMALIHEELYRSKNIGGIDFSEYLRTLTAGLFYSYGANPDAIALKIEVSNTIGVEDAIPCGLIINELVSNSLKYAFPREKEGEIRIELLNGGDDPRLVVSDNGVGIPKGIDFNNTETFGLRLVNMLVEQLEGTIELDRGGGTEFTITFKKSIDNVRVKRRLSGLKSPGHAAFATPSSVKKAVKMVKEGESSPSFQKKA